MQYEVKNEIGMSVLAAAIASSLKKGDTVALIGDLGTGKTTLSKGIGRALGIEGIMASPSYTIVNAYTCQLGPFYHADVYRLNSIEELDDIGFFDYLHDNGIVLVEWADKVLSALAYETKQLIQIELSVYGEGRLVTLSGYPDGSHGIQADGGVQGVYETDFETGLEASLLQLTSDDLRRVT